MMGSFFGPARSVSDLFSYIQSMIDNDIPLSSIKVSGELSNVKRHFSSGHIYFTLKEGGCALSCVMFRTHASRLGFEPEDGMAVTAIGRIKLYDRDGRVEFLALELCEAGSGDEYSRYQEIYKKLEAEGLFAESHKRTVTSFPRRIGLVTSASGAAKQDVCATLSRRYPLCELLFSPATVQGRSGARSIERALAALSGKNCDTVIVCRGGGSSEDLSCFNDEMLARAIAAFEVPVICAAGHETDVTICELAADMRASTPTAAAELSSSDISRLSQDLCERLSDIEAEVTRRVGECGSLLESFASRFQYYEPFEVYREKLVAYDKKIFDGVFAAVSMMNTSLSSYERMIKAFSPVEVMKRGYTAIFKNGRSVTSAALLSEGDEITVRFADGSVRAVVAK